MTEPVARQGRCPSCGAGIEFKLGASRATVCSHCQAIVVRSGQDFEAVGKVADLIPTGSRIGLGSHGVIGGLGFDVIGRLQYEWQQGVWDEWYLAFADGRWGWLAEAQGRFYVTMRMSPRPLPRRGVEPGQSFFIQGLGRFTVSDVKQARVAGAQGELPDPVTPGESPLTADCESEKGGFATLDFGDGTGEAVLYAGRQVPFEALHLGERPDQPPTRQAPRGEKLTCPNCGAPLSVRVPDQSVRVVCESCNHLLDTSQGAFRVIGALERGRKEPRIPLGSAGLLRGRQFLLVGWMLRSCTVDGVRYPWGEYLLWEEKAQGFAWLVESEGHWQLATAISVADVHAADDAEYQGKRFRHFSSVKGRVDQVLGEFYWAVQAGDEVQIDEYIRPPEGLARELGDGEVNWTHLEHLERAEVAKAFDRPGLVQERPQGVGELQPWPHQATWRTLRRWMAGGILGLLVLLGAFAARPGRVLVDQDFTPLELLAGDAEPSPGGERMHGYLSPEFTLGGRGALRVDLSSDAVGTWAYAEGAVINTDSGEAAPFGVESSYYSGVDDGERWTEDHRTGSVVIEGPGGGQAILRADLQWEQGRSPPSVRLRLRGENFSLWQFLGCLALLSWPLVYPLRAAAFERARWENSNLGSGGDD